MATQRLKNTLKNLRITTTQQEAMIRAGYSISYSKTGQLKQTKGWKELSEKALPDKLLLKIHKEGLGATKLTNSLTAPDMIIADYPTRHKYLESAYKVRGKIKEDPQGDTFNTIIFTDEQLIEIARRRIARSERSEESPD